MKRKIIALITVVMVFMVGFGAYTVFADSYGYDTYKDALKKTHTISNSTTTINVQVKTNGELIQDFNTVMKYNGDQSLAQGTVDLKTTTDHLQVNGIMQDSKAIFQSDGEDTYYVTELEGKESHKEKVAKFHNPKMMKFGEMAFDTLTKPMHSQFEFNNQHITVNMTNDDIPTPLNIFGSFMMKKGFEHHNGVELSTDDYPFLLNNVSFDMPILQDDITVERVVIDAELADEGYFKSHNMLLNISGKDANSKEHRLEIQVKMAMDDVNQTTVDKIDIDEDNAEFFELKHGHKFH